MDLFEAIQKRHSYRGDYTDRQVSRDDLVKIVKAGLLAPSGKNCQTTRFVIVDDPDIIEKIKGMHPGNKAFQQAKAYILCVIDKAPEAIYEGFSFEVEDCAAAVENMLLSITALGYASVWIDGWLRVENRAEKIGQLLGVPEDKVVRIILPVGVAAEEKSQPEKLPLEKRASFNSWNL
ncbi:nitroreductase A [Limihaloglobus sulfuriphilus]|uniref:Nitroreductase A n=1 Tax=Limihaloglobus sulfuriphilus TaxID=1851148 RepID=A0A1R7T655_9BACT|nr:nitroreductase family protein [Limihaloglobus sulfuriphilus]AQQ72343.1 nitroreductase A [Limihaloglobus sulfuriphilus]